MLETLSIVAYVEIRNNRYVQIISREDFVFYTENPQRLYVRLQ
jgi:hypothetical protein